MCCENRYLNECYNSQSELKRSRHCEKLVEDLEGLGISRSDNLNSEYIEVSKEFENARKLIEGRYQVCRLINSLEYTDITSISYKKIMFIL